MNRTTIFSLLALLPAAAAGQNGVGLIESARALEEGAARWSLPAVQSDFDSFGLVRDSEPGFRFSPREGTEWGLSVPLRRDGETEAEGLRFLRAALKLQLHASESDASAVSFYGTVVPEEMQKGIGSGDNNFGVSVNFSDRADGGATAMHSLLQLERSDSRLLLDSGVAEYQVTTKLRFGLGIEQRVSTRGQFLLQSLVTIAAGEDAQKGFGLQITPGYQYRFDNGFGVTLAAGVDLPQGGIEPERQYLVALTYTAPPPRPTRKELAQQLDVAQMRLSELEQRLAAVEPTVAVVPELRQSVVKLEATDAEHGAMIDALKRRTGLLRVEILDASGMQGLGEAVAKRLLDAGYLVVRVDAAAGPVQKTTVIRYREGLAKPAVELGHTLRRVQVVAKGSDLAADVDARIILGLDQR